MPDYIQGAPAKVKSFDPRDAAGYRCRYRGALTLGVVAGSDPDPVDGCSIFDSFAALTGTCGADFVGGIGNHLYTCVVTLIWLRLHNYK
jgi:hypothetical protein